AYDVGLGRGPYDQATHRPLSFLNSESASCMPVCTSVREMATCWPRLSIVVQPRSCSGFSENFTITLPSFGLFAWLMVNSRRPFTLSSFSARKSPDSTIGSLARNDAAVQPIGHWPKSFVAGSHIVTWKPSATILSCEGGSYSKRIRPGRRT